MFMKKILLQSLTLLLIDIALSMMLVGFCLVKKFTIFILMLSIVVNLIITEKFYRNIKSKQKCYVYLILIFMISIVSLLFCLYQYYFKLWDIIGIALVVIYVIFFRIIPYLLIAMIYFIKYKIKDK